MDDSSSHHSSESIVIHKLGFDSIEGTNRSLASVMNCVTLVGPIVHFILILVTYIHCLAIGMAVSDPSVYEDSQLSNIVKTILQIFLRFSFYNSSQTVYLVLLVVFFVAYVIWIILYCIFSYRYDLDRNFSPVIIRIMHFLGTTIFPIISLPVATVTCYYIKPLFGINEDEASLITFLAFATLVLHLYITNMMTNVVQSSPLIDIKDKMCLWPTNPFLAKFQFLLLFFVTFVNEIISKNWYWSSYLMCVISLITGIVGTYFVIISNDYLVQAGQIIAASQYVVMSIAAVVTIIATVSKIQSAYFLAVGVVLIIIFVFVYTYLLNKKLRENIDILYLPFEEMIEVISKPKMCINLMKIGLVYNAPCITNQTLSNWALSRWPTDQDLVFFCVFLAFVQHLPHMEILDLLSAAVDINPFSNFDDLLAYQIFIRLPTQETKLKLRLERIRKLYEIPQQSLQHFWSAVTRRHWDEAYIHCCQLQEETQRIFNMFANLIFENPNYDFVMIEFRRFVEEIQGNIQLANAVEQEVDRRKTEIKASSQQDTGSIAQLSRLSSVRSSIFLSEFSENQTPTEKAQSSIFSAVEARPIYSPNRITTISLLLALTALILNVVVWVIIRGNRATMGKQTELAIQLQTLAELSGETLELSLEFLGEKSGSTLNPEGFDLPTSREQLNAFSKNFDVVMSNLYSAHSALPASFIRRWVDQNIETKLLSGTPGIPTMVLNQTYLFAVRLFQNRAAALSLTDPNFIGTITSPRPEVEQIAYLYPSICQVISTMTTELAKLVIEDDKRMKLEVNIITICIFIAGFVITAFSTLFLCLYVYKEFNFLMEIYSFIPIKALQRLVENEKSGMIDEVDLQLTQNSKQQRPPLSSYHIPNIIITYAVFYILLDIPGIINLISHTQHLKEATIVASGFELNSRLITESSQLFLTTFDFVTGFSNTSRSELRQQMLNELGDMLKMYQALLYGNDERFKTGLIISRPKEILRIFHEKCQAIEPIDSPNRYAEKNINCTSFDTDFNSIFTMIHQLDSINGYPTEELKSGWWKLFYPVIDKMVHVEIMQFREVFYDVAVQVRNRAAILDIVSMVITVLEFVVIPIITFYLVKTKLQPSMSSLLKPIVLMPPECIVESPFMLRFLQGDLDKPSRTLQREKQKKDDTSTPLIDYILEGILVLSPDGTIVASNRKYHEMMLNSQEEVLGVNVRSIFTLPIPTIFDAIDRIREGTHAPFQTVNCETSMFTADDRELQVRISLIAQTKHNGRLYRATSLALIITDRSELIKAQTQLRKEKANVEELLDSILPHLIAVSLLNGQSDISFDVEKACVLFSDIVSFTPLCSSKTAKQIITTLNTLFTEFDSALALFTRVTKLKTIGDAYVCAAGLFEGDGPIEEAAKEIVKLACMMIDIIPNVNQELSLNLQMRIGIYTGGPLICGVLGKEKPFFEAIGSVMTIAEDLESTSLPNRVHISQDTADLIRDLDFKLEDRGGNISIQGLGKTATYIILPPNSKKDDT